MRTSDSRAARSVAPAVLQKLSELNMKRFRVSFAAAAAAIAQLAVGQTAAPDINPADPRATTVPAHYQSAFSGYRPYRDAELADWREVNDRVRTDQGAHVGHGSQGGSDARRPQGSPSP